MTCARALWIAAALALAACVPRPKPPAAATEAHAATTSQTAATEAPALEGARFVAVIAADGVTNVTAQVEGPILSVDVRLGGEVKVGDRLATVDDRPLREAVKAARAVAEMRRAEARVAVVRANRAAAELKRARLLVVTGLVTGQSVDGAEGARAEAAATVQRARAAASEASAQLEQARRNLEHAVVRAPVAGIVALRFVDPGNEIRRGEPLLRILSRETPWIRFGMPAREGRAVAVGKQITFASLDGRRSTPAKVTHVAPDVDPLSELVLAEARFDAPLDPGFYPGLGGYVVAGAPAMAPGRTGDTP